MLKILSPGTGKLKCVILYESAVALLPYPNVREELSEGDGSSSKD